MFSRVFHGRCETMSLFIFSGLTIAVVVSSAVWGQEIAAARRDAQVACEKLSASDDRNACVIGTVALLHAEWLHEVSYRESTRLRTLAQLSWPQQPRADLRSSVAAALEKGPARDTPQFVEWQKFIESKAAFVKAGGDKWPFDWETRRDLWIDLVTTFAEAKGAANPAEVWRTRIAAAGSDATIYRWAYLAAVAEKQPGKIDLELVQPLIHAAETPTVQLLIMAQIFSAYVEGRRPQDLSAAIPPLDEMGLRMRSAVVKYVELSASPELRDVIRIVNALRGSIRHGGWSPESERQLKRAALRRWDALVFAQVFPHEPDWFLSKPVRVAVQKDVPVREVVRQLLSEVALNVWTDLAVHRDERRITTREIQGTWLDVTEAVLAQADLVLLAPLPDFYWIAPKSAAASREEFVARCRRKFPASDAINSRKVAAQLDENTVLECDRTPLSEVVAYLSDFHAISVRAATKGDQLTSVNLRCPLWLGVSLLCEDLGLDWTAGSQGILLGNAEDLAQFRRREAEQVRRRLRQFAREQPATKALEKPLPAFSPALFRVLQKTCAVSLDCDLVVSRSLLERIVPEPSVGDRDSLETFLDALPYDLDWEADAHLIYVGERRRALAYGRAIDMRAERRQAYPPALAKKLQQPIRGDLGTESLGKLLTRIADEQKIPIHLAKGLDDRPVQLTVRPETQLPLDVLLDLLATETDCLWRLKDGRIEWDVLPRATTP